jgi:hypothetical protein
MCCGCCGDDPTRWNKARGYGGLIGGIILLAFGGIVAIYRTGCSKDGVPTHLGHSLESTTDCLLECDAECHVVELFAGVLIAASGAMMLLAGAFTTWRRNADKTPRSGVAWGLEIAVCVVAVVGAIFSMVVATAFAAYVVPFVAAVAYAVVSCGFLDSARGPQ